MTIEGIDHDVFHFVYDRAHGAAKNSSPRPSLRHTNEGIVTVNGTVLERSPHTPGD